jgi:hypothetical protein
MALSFYEENPEAFSQAARRKDFQDRLLEGTGLALIVSSDPENPNQARAKSEVLLLIERAWLATLQAAEGLQVVHRQVTA